MLRLHRVRRISDSAPLSDRLGLASDPRRWKTSKREATASTRRLEAESTIRRTTQIVVLGRPTLLRLKNLKTNPRYRWHDDRREHIWRWPCCALAQQDSWRKPSPVSLPRALTPGDPLVRCLGRPNRTSQMKLQILPSSEAQISLP